MHRLLPLFAACVAGSGFAAPEPLPPDFPFLFVAAFPALVFF